MIALARRVGGGLGNLQELDDIELEQLYEINRLINQQVGEGA